MKILFQNTYYYFIFVAYSYADVIKYGGWVGKYYCSMPARFRCILPLVFSTAKTTNVHLRSFANMFNSHF